LVSPARPAECEKAESPISVVIRESVNLGHYSESSSVTRRMHFLQIDARALRRFLEQPAVVEQRIPFVDQFVNRVLGERAIIHVRPFTAACISTAITKKCQ